MNTRPRFIALLLFVAALLPRLPGLGRFLTSDEKTNIFIAGSDVIAAFLRGDLRGTYWHFYPGVTMSWLDAAGMAGQYWLDLLAGVPLPAFSEYIYGDILSLVVAARLPYALLTAAAIPAMYLLAGKLLPRRVALLGALFLAFDPFFLAHSRVAHGDAPVAVFMSLSALAFFIYLEQSRKTMNLHRANEPGEPGAGKFSSLAVYLPGIFHPRQAFFYLILSAALGGLAALTKAPGQFMALFVTGLAFYYAGLELWRWRSGDPVRPKATHSPAAAQAMAPSKRLYALAILVRWLAVVIIWGLVSLAVFILLWPSMWVDPIGTLRQVWAETFTKVNEGHLVYFWGSPTLDPGFWFYFYVIPFRMTPVILAGSLISLLWLGINLISRRPFSGGSTKIIFLLWLFTITLLLFGNLSPKKQDRYLLPLFPFLNLLAAIGWCGLVDLFQSLVQARFKTRFPVANPAVIILLLLHFLPVLTYYPYYLTYFNPLMGGPTRAAGTTLMGWGEGMEQVAAYLNTKPNASSLYVASTPSQTLLPYFAGTGENFYTNDIAFRADYVVLYLAQMQRLAPSPDIVRYFQARQPEKIITIKDVPYAKIYPGPKLILPDIPPEAVPTNIGLDDTMRLAGYKLADPQSSGSELRLTLYWHALKPISANYTISVRVRAGDGRLLAQQDNWPVDNLLPTSLWRQGDYVVDTHTLEISETDMAQATDVEIVVYNRDTGETLGPPITLPAGNER